MDPKASGGLNTQIYEQACEWFVEFRGGSLDAAARQGLAAWLRKSPEHVRAYLEIAALWNEGPALDPTGKWDEVALMAEVAREPGNVLSHPKQLHPGRDPALQLETRSAVASRGRRALAVAATVLVACLGAWFYSQRNLYTTAIAEQRSIRLEDGSTIDLNSHSKVEVRYSAGARAVELVAGQALFQVAKDAHRPFIVTSGDTHVRAVGTEFDVNRKRSGTVVTVLEGRVAVTSDAAFVPNPSQQSNPAVASDGAIVLSAGEQLRLAQKNARVAPANLAAATAWKQRQLIFESATLADVAEEFNRYNERQLIIEDAALDDFHISGVFSTVDTRGLLDFLKTRPGVEITETAAGYRIAGKIPHPE